MSSVSYDLLVGASRGTQSAAFIAAQLVPYDGGADGFVLTSTMLIDFPGNRPVPDMPLGNIRIQTRVVHHKQDGCNHCNPAYLPRLIEKLTSTTQKELIMFDGGKSQGDPCEAMAYHGFNGIEHEVVRKIAEWITLGPQRNNIAAPDVTVSGFEKMFWFGRIMCPALNRRNYSD